MSRYSQIFPLVFEAVRVTKLQVQMQGFGVGVVFELKSGIATTGAPHYLGRISSLSHLANQQPQHFR